MVVILSLQVLTQRSRISAFNYFSHYKAETCEWDRQGRHGLFQKVKTSPKLYLVNKLRYLLYLCQLFFLLTSFSIIPSCEDCWRVETVYVCGMRVSLRSYH